jgi:Domain of unknown function (DUF4304)
MSPSESAVAIIVDRIVEALRAFGFSRRGKRTVVSEQGDVLWLVELQKSKKSTGNELVFTINLGVYSLLLAKRLGQSDRRPEVADCHWTQRLGVLSGELEDKWWDVSDVFEATNVGEEITRLLKNYALPTFARLGSTAALRALWQTGQCPGLTEYQRNEYLKVLMQEKSAMLQQDEQGFTDGVRDRPGTV